MFPLSNFNSTSVRFRGAASETPANPLTAVLSLLTWGACVFITDGRQFTFQTNIENSEGGSKLYTVNANKPSEIDQMLDQESDATKPPRLFLIACHYRCIHNVLTKVNIHERQYGEQGVLIYRHRWLILTDSYDEFHRIEMLSGNITNLSVFIAPERWKPVARIYSATWKPEARRLQLSAHVKDGSVYGEIYPNLKYGLNGRKLLLTINEWRPYVIKDTTKVGNEQYTGLCIELMEVISTQMNFTYTLIEPPDGSWGGVRNGSWTGMVGQLVDKTADMVAAPLIISSAREHVMDFSSPFYNEVYHILYKPSGNSTFEPFLFIRPYKWQVWLCMCLIIPTVGLLLWSFGHIQRCIHRKRKRDVPEFTLVLTIWSVVGVLFNQSVDMVKTRSHVIRRVFLSWVFTCIVYTATYSSNLVALLAVHVEHPPFNSLETLVEQQQFKFGTVGETFTTNMLKRSSGVSGQIWERMTEWEQNGVPVISTSESVHLDLVHKGNYAYLADATSISILQQTACDLRTFKGNLYPSLLGISLQNNSAYTKPVSEIVMTLRETGVLSRWVRKYWPKETGCLKTSSTTTSSVRLKGLSGLFHVFVGMLALATIILGIEIFTHNFKVMRVEPKDILVNVISNLPKFDVGQIR